MEVDQLPSTNRLNTRPFIHLAVVAAQSQSGSQSPLPLVLGFLPAVLSVFLPAVVFGRVVEGMGVVKRIETMGTASGKPKARVTVADCGQVSSRQLQGVCLCPAKVAASDELLECHQHAPSIGKPWLPCSRVCWWQSRHSCTVLIRPCFYCPAVAQSAGGLDAAAAGES